MMLLYELVYINAWVDLTNRTSGDLSPLVSKEAPSRLLNL